MKEQIQQEHEVDHGRKLKVEVKLLPHGDFKRIEVDSSDTVLEVMLVSAKALEVEVLPPQPAAPLDEFYCVDNHDGLHRIDDLSQSMKDLMEHKDCKRRLALGLVRAFKVNALWRVAPKELMTPREILALFGMDHTQFTLYRRDSETPLPLDEPIKVERGACFEAIKDGRYGNGE